MAAISLAAVLVLGAIAPLARADGDPGSDVLVYQDLFVGTEAGLSIPQQARLGGLLKAAARSGFPIRVAIIAGPADLGAVTELWRKPQTYARFLGLELSLAYRQRLLVVMPNGLGFNWPGHATTSAYRLLARVTIGPGGGGLLGAAQAAVRTLALTDGVKLRTMAGPPSAAAPAAGAGSATRAVNAPGQAADSLVAIIVVALAAIAAAGAILRRRLRQPGGPRRRAPAGDPRRRAPAGGPRGRVPPLRGRWALPSVALLALVPVVAIAALGNVGASGRSQREALASNPYLDPGTPLSGPAPGFTLSDQFGQPVSLRSFRGKVVILAFNDSECTTVCPLTTTAMLDAKAMLGQAGSRVQLLGIDANPAAISLEDVWSYSQLHGMLHAWRFLTGSLPGLKHVWKRYAVEAAVERGQITHTPALFVIDPQGREAKVYITQMSYAATGQLGQVLAHEASSLLPGHPPVRSDLSYARIAPITPTHTVTLPRAGGRTISLGPGRSARLFLFFATWDRETSGLAGELDALNGYAAVSRRLGLPPVTAVDEATVEPSSRTLTGFLARLPRPLSYPVAIDRTGRVADGYEVLGAPWFVLTSATGQLLYYREVSTAGWPSPSVLIQTVREALARAPKTPSNASAAQRALAVSPAPLAALHVQAGRLLGTQAALNARVRALRGYAIVLNAWASWCGPCRTEFPLLASASLRYGRQIAFLGADNNDSPGDARAFLAQHGVTYPSYQTTTASLSSLAAIDGLPTTIFISPAGKVVYVHTGQYYSQGTLDGDIKQYALSP